MADRLKIGDRVHRRGEFKDWHGTVIEVRTIGNACAPSAVVEWDERNGRGALRTVVKATGLRVVTATRPDSTEDTQ